MTRARYESASDAKLDLIIGHAEDRLQAQLETAIAADSRAMTFASVLAAVAAALIAFGTDKQFTWAICVLISGLLIATTLALWSSSPIAWDLPGNDPSTWIDDIADTPDAASDIKPAKAAMISYFDDMIVANRNRASVAATWMRLSWWTLIMSSVIAAGLAFYGK